MHIIILKKGFIMNKIVTLLLIILIISSCGFYRTTQYYEEYLTTLLGISETQLIQIEGIPTKVYETKDTKFITYYKEYSNYSTSNSYSYPNNEYIGTNTTEIQTHHKEYCETMFTLINDKVTNYTFKGNKCDELIYKGETITSF